MSDHSGKNLLFAGVGGQGILLIAEIAARAAIRAGFDAKKTEVHGAAQRGGSVVSHVRFSEKVFSPVTPAGEVDILLALEKLEALRWAHFVRDGGLIIINDEERMPMPLDSTPVKYPPDIPAFLSGKGFVVQLVDAVSVAKELGNFRAANTVLLGVMAAHTGISDDHWIEVMKESLNRKILEVNLSAFQAGKELESAGTVA